MSASDVVLTLLTFLSGIIGVLIGVVATRNKTRAETHHAEAEATADIVSGYQQLLQARTDELAARDAALAQETEVARGADERAHTLPAPHEQRDKVVSQEAGCASDKDQ